MSTTDLMVETQLCKLRGTSDTFVGRACSIVHLFERSVYLIHPKKKSLRVYPCARVPRARVHMCNNLGFSVWYYVPHTYVPGVSSLSAGYQDTHMYIRMCQGGVRIMCHICT